MFYKTSITTAILLGLLSAGCQTIPEELPMKDGLTKDITLPVTGLTRIKRKGKFSIGETRIDYVRGENSQGFLDMRKTKKRTWFEYEAQFGRTSVKCLETEKLYGREDKDRKIVMEPMSYDCEFSGSAIPNNASVTLRETPDTATQYGNLKLSENTARLGETIWGSTKLSIESEHNYAAIDVPVPDSLIAPTGYYIYQGSEAVAAIDFIDDFKLYKASNLSSEVDEALMATVSSILMHVDPELCDF